MYGFFAHPGMSCIVFQCLFIIFLILNDKFVYCNDQHMLLVVFFGLSLNKTLHATVKERGCVVK